MNDAVQPAPAADAPAAGGNPPAPAPYLIDPDPANPFGVLVNRGTAAAPKYVADYPVGQE